MSHKIVDLDKYREEKKENKFQDFIVKLREIYIAQSNNDDGPIIA